MALFYFSNVFLYKKTLTNNNSSYNNMQLKETGFCDVWTEQWLRKYIYHIHNIRLDWIDSTVEHCARYKLLINCIVPSFFISYNMLNVYFSGKRKSSNTSDPLFFAVELKCVSTRGLVAFIQRFETSFFLFFCHILGRIFIALPHSVISMQIDPFPSDFSFMHIFSHSGRLCWYYYSNTARYQAVLYCRCLSVCPSVCL